jgi:AhpD family alkylhydroperoxidase
MGKIKEIYEDIEKTLGIVPGFMKALPDDVLINEWPSFKKYVLGESQIPAKYRELIGLAVAANIKCPYCQLFHKSAAKLHGATDSELSELAFLASFSSRWSAMIHAQHYDYATFEKETHQIGAHLKKAMSK